MKKDLLDSYHNIRKIRDEIPKRIHTTEVKEFLEMVIKNNFLESQNIQLLLNLQLQSRTIEDLKNIVTRQQKFIQENNIQVTDESIRTDMNFFSPPQEEPSASDQIAKEEIKEETNEPIEEYKDIEKENDDGQSMARDAENLIAIVGSAIKNINDKLENKPLTMANKASKKIKVEKPDKAEKVKPQGNLSISGNKIANTKKPSKSKK